MRLVPLMRAIRSLVSCYAAPDSWSTKNSRGSEASLALLTCNCTLKVDWFAWPTGNTAGKQKKVMHSKTRKLRISVDIKSLRSVSAGFTDFMKMNSKSVSGDSALKHLKGSLNFWTSTSLRTQRGITAELVEDFKALVQVTAGLCNFPQRSTWVELVPFLRSETTSKF